MDKNDVGAQVRMAAQCCKLADIMIAQGDYMWLVPQRLIDQARRVTVATSAAAKRQIVRKTKSVSPLGSAGPGSSGSMSPDTTNPYQRLFNAKHVHKIVI